MAKKKDEGYEKHTTPAGETFAVPTESEAVLGPTVEKNGKPKLTKRERFLKYAPKRVQKVLNAFRQLGNVTNKGSYEYSEAEVAKIMDSITSGVTILRNKFAGSKEAKEVFAL